MGREGVSTSTAKNQNEWVWGYSFTAAKEIMSSRVTAAGTVENTAGPDSLLVYGEALAIAATGPILTAESIAYTLTGTDQNDVALVGTATMPANSAQGRAIDVTVAAGKRFKTLASITVAVGDGAVGDEVVVVALPETYTLLGYDKSANPQTGARSRAIANKFEPVDHYKRIRPENTLRITSLYLNDKTGLMAIAGRDVTMRAQIKEDGYAVGETHFYSKVRFSSNVNVPDNADCEVSAEGNFRRKIVFS